MRWGDNRGLREAGVANATQRRRARDATSSLAMSTIQHQERTFHDRTFRELSPATLASPIPDRPNEVTPYRNIGRCRRRNVFSSAPLMLVVARFSLISRCTHRAHGAI
jgi:hypothetical protein